MRFRFSIIVCLIVVPLVTMLGLYGLRKLHIARLFNTANNRATVTQVAPDPEIPGKVYAEVTCESCTADGLPKVYESSDYGQHWQPSAQPFPTSFQTDNGLYIDSGDLSYRGQKVWVPPKSIFRNYFHELSHGFQMFRSSGYQLHVGSFVSSPDKKVVYASMESAGVLIGPNPPTSDMRPWQISHAGIDGILSPLSVRNPVTIGVVIVFLLLIPPLPLLHAWLIGQAYRYLYPIDESDKAIQLGLKVSAALTVLAAGAIWFWLTNEVVDGPFLLIGMSAFTALFSVGTAVSTARRCGFSNGFTLRLAASTGLLSLITPLVIPGLFQDHTWVIILTLVIGFIGVREAMSIYLNEQKARITLWQTDQMAIELLVVFLGIFLLLCSLAYQPVMIYKQMVLGVVLVFLIPAISISVLAAYANLRAKSLVVKKTGILESNLHHNPLFSTASWWFVLFQYTFYWLFCGLAVFGIIAWAQSLLFYWSESFGG